MKLKFITQGFLLFFRIRGTILGPFVFLSMMFIIEGSFWSSLSNGNGYLGHYSLKEMLFYVFIALTISQVTACIGEPDSLTQKIEFGQLDHFLLKPVSYLEQMGAIQLGITCARLFCFLPLLIAITIILGESLHFVRLFYLLIMIPVSSLINFLTNNAISNLAFWFRESYGFIILKETLFWVLSGVLIPLDFFPPFMQKILVYFPPAYVVYFPAKMYMGQENPTQIIINSFFILLVTFFCFHLGWRKGVKRYQGYSG